MTTFFITGIDTGVGKTWATGMAARFLQQQGKKVITQKLVQTGQDNALSEDIVIHRRLMETAPLPEDFPNSQPDMPDSSGGTLTCPYQFHYPASPHLAARLEGRTIEPEKITQCTAMLQKRYDFVLLEGAGGFLVPLTPDMLTADYIGDRGYPIILVTSGRLGSINHTLLTIEAVFRRNLSLACLVFNLYPEQDETIASDTFQLFRKLCFNIVVLPRIDTDNIAKVDYHSLVNQFE